MWPLDYLYPTQADALQALAIVWAKLGIVGETSPRPDTALFARALYTAGGYGLSLGFPGSIPQSAQTANVEARIKELLNPYFGQPIGTNLGQHIGGEHPRYDLLHLDFSDLTPLLLQQLKIVHGTKPGEATVPPASAGELPLPSPEDPMFQTPASWSPDPASNPASSLPGYPPRNMPCD
jgi:hypothetical protein